MKKIIIFTNYSSILTFDDFQNFDSRNFNCLKQIDDKIFAYNEAQNRLDVVNGVNFNIYLIKDDIKEEEFKKTFSNPDEYYILRHTKPLWGLFANVPTIINGRHEPKGPHYDKLVEILCDDTNTDKYKTIVDTLFPNAEQKKEAADSLLIKLQLLHEIYEGKPTSEISADKSLEEFSKKITDFKATVTKYNNEDNNHRAALIELRDALLADV